VLTVGGAAVTPLATDAEIPLHQLVTVGRTTNLRGYAKNRFRDTTGWWANAEYRYPLFEYADTGAGLSAAIFFDAGGVGPTLRELWEKPVRYAPGIGIRAEAPSDFVFRAQAAYSSEGIEAGLSLSEHYDL
jgi:outer membrane protein assembly factor BamA